MLVNAAGLGKMGTAAEIAEREPEAGQETDLIRTAVHSPVLP